MDGFTSKVQELQEQCQLEVDRRAVVVQFQRRPGVNDQIAVVREAVIGQCFELTGGVLRPDKGANRNAYTESADARQILSGSGPATVPAAARSFMSTLARESAATSRRPVGKCSGVRSSPDTSHNGATEPPPPEPHSHGLGLERV